MKAQETAKAKSPRCQRDLLQGIVPATNNDQLMQARPQGLKLGGDEATELDKPTKRLSKLFSQGVGRGTTAHHSAEIGHALISVDLPKKPVFWEILVHIYICRKSARRCNPQQSWNPDRLRKTTQNPAKDHPSLSRDVVSTSKIIILSAVTCNRCLPPGASTLKIQALVHPIFFSSIPRLSLDFDRQMPTRRK